jgi:hypothetical protein
VVVFALQASLWDQGLGGRLFCFSISLYCISFFVSLAVCTLVRLVWQQKRRIGFLFPWRFATFRLYSILPVQYFRFAQNIHARNQSCPSDGHEGNEQEEVKAVVRVVFPEQRWLHAREPLAVGTKSKHAEAKAVRKDPDEKNKLKDAGKWSCSACGLTLARKDNVQRPGFSLLSTLSEPYQHRTEAQQ